MAVALLIAIFILCLTQRWYTAAAFVIGMGFALKLTPLALLPLVLLLAGPPRRWGWLLVAFVAAAAAPFLPYVLRSWSGVWHVFQYHLERPLQIESVLGTPQLLGQLLGADWASWAWSHGSHSLVAPGVGLAADMSGGLTLLAVAAVYLFAWLRRERLRAAPADQALVVLALLLALMTFGKVLSPQYFIWILPAWALVAARDRWLAVLGGLALALTHAEFPAQYWNLLDMQPAPLAIVVARNTLLLAAFVSRSGGCGGCRRWPVTQIGAASPLRAWLPLHRERPGGHPARRVAREVARLHHERVGAGSETAEEAVGPGLVHGHRPVGREAAHGGPSRVPDDDVSHDRRAAPGQRVRHAATEVAGTTRRRGRREPGSGRGSAVDPDRDALDRRHVAGGVDRPDLARADAVDVGRRQHDVGGGARHSRHVTSLSR